MLRKRNREICDVTTSWNCEIGVIRGIRVEAKRKLKVRVEMFPEMLKVYFDVLVVIEVRVLNRNDLAWKIFSIFFSKSKIIC